MKYLILILLLAVACSKGGNSASPVAAALVPAPTATPSDSATPSPTPTPTPTPIAATPTPTPTPQLSYDCTNHPLLNQTLSNSGVGYQLILHSDCTAIFQDSHHISYGTWSPDSDPHDIVTVGSTVEYPITLTPNGSYICLPANGPQNCSNYDFAGPVYVEIDVNANTVNDSR